MSNRAWKRRRARRQWRNDVTYDLAPDIRRQARRIFNTAVYRKPFPMNRKWTQAWISLGKPPF